MRRFRKTLATAVLTTLLVGSTAGWASASRWSEPSGPLPGTFGDLTDTQQRSILPAGDVTAHDAYFTASTLVAVGVLG